LDDTQAIHFYMHYNLCVYFMLYKARNVFVEYGFIISFCFVVCTCKWFYQDHRR